MRLLNRRFEPANKLRTTFPSTDRCILSVPNSSRLFESADTGRRSSAPLQRAWSTTRSVSAEAWRTFGTRARSVREELREERVVEAEEGTTAEADGADGARGVLVGEGNIGARGFFVEGHFRDERDAHAGSYHAEKAAELTALEDDLRAKSGAIAGGEGVFTEAMTIAKKEEGFGAEILQSERRRARECSCGRAANSGSVMIGKDSNS